MTILWSMLDALGAIIGIGILLMFLALSRAISVRVVTGKWPHQDETSLKIYRDLP